MLNIKNPGNIRISGTTYEGEVIPSANESFKQFETPAYGYRAMFLLLYTYIVVHGCDTITKMISRWAPPTDNNNTAAYISNVASACGVGADDEFNYSDEATFESLVTAMSHQENGVTAVNQDVIDGYALYEKKKELFECVGGSTGIAIILLLLLYVAKKLGWAS